MRITTSSVQNEIVLIQVEGEVDAHTARELDRTLLDLLAEGHSRLLLDASQMGFISSAGLRAIVFAQRDAQRRGGEVRVCGLDAQLRYILETARLDECLKLRASCREAMEGW